MTWIKLEDKTPRHPKVAGLTDRAFRAWICSLCYASEFLTDGFLPLPFLSTVKAAVQNELVIAGLWIVNDDASVQIHDYLEHQTAKDQVDRERERKRKNIRDYRERNRTSNRLPVAVTQPVSNQPVTKPDTEDRRQKTDTEDRKDEEERASSTSLRSVPLIRSQKEIHEKLKHCAFVGARLDVPTKLHGDLRRSLGGQNGDADLLAWYQDLDEEIEISGESIVPDVWKWLEARYKSWRKSCEPAPKSSKEIVLETLARQRAESAARR